MDKFLPETQKLPYDSGAILSGDPRLLAQYLETLVKELQLKLEEISASVNLTQIKTGSYTGDGSTGQSITGLGFTPSVVIIFLRAGSEANQDIFIKIDQGWGDYCYLIDADSQTVDNRINSLDIDGFTVDDDGADSHPNKNSSTYDYVAFR